MFHRCRETWIHENSREITEKNNHLWGSLEFFRSVDLFVSEESDDAGETGAWVSLPTLRGAWTRPGQVWQSYFTSLERAQGAACGHTYSEFDGSYGFIRVVVHAIRVWKSRVSEMIEYVLHFHLERSVPNCLNIIRYDLYVSSEVLVKYFMQYETVFVSKIWWIQIKLYEYLVCEPVFFF